MEHWGGWSIGRVEHWEGWSIGEGGALGGVEHWALGGVGGYFQSIKCLCLDVCMFMVYMCVCVSV